MPRLKIVLLPSLFLSAVFVAPVRGAEVQAGVTVGGGYSDNIRRVANDEESEGILSAGIDASVFHDSSRWYANLLADLSYLDYRHNTYDSEVVGNADANVYWRIVPERFGWMLNDNFGQVRSEPFTPVTPDQRENVNFLSTGPDLTAPLGERSRFRVFGRYSTVDYEESITDNDRYGAGAAYIHDLSNASFISLNAQTERVQYKDIQNSDYVIRQGYMRYRIGSSRTELTMEAGYNDVKREDDTRENGPLARFRLSRNMTAATTLTLSGGYELSDAALNFRTLESTQGNTASAAVVPQSNPFKNSYASLEWRFSKQRTGLGASLTYGKEQYLRDAQPNPQTNLASQDRTRKGATLMFTRRVTANLTADLAGSALREESATVTSDDLSGRFGLGWALGQHYTLSLRYEYFDRSASDNRGVYTEQRIWLQIRYGTPRIPLQPRVAHTAERW